MVHVEICADRNVWDKYVDSHPSASNSHRWCWRQVIEETFGHKSYYLTALKDGTVQGVLPLFAIRSHLFGNSLVSVPFFSYGGLLTDSSEAGEALMANAIELAQPLGARYIELRLGGRGSIDWQKVAPKVTMEVEIRPTVNELWDSLSARVRKRIRHARKAGFKARWGGIEDVGDFYAVFATNMRNLGTPVYPRAWFENLCLRCPRDVRILTLSSNNKPVASAFLIAYRAIVELPWAASLDESRPDFAPLLLYWTMLEWATENGFRRVDLGRCTPGSGNHAFKRHWTQEERPLDRYYWVAPGYSLPQIRPENPRYRLAIQVWKHLPLAIANQLGPRIVRALP
jgi:FemAB-related protein (PEP-CTERM system-associated)